MATPFETKCQILAELWLEYRNDEEFTDFCEYNDLGLPLAYCHANGILVLPEKAMPFVNEAFALLLDMLGIDSDDEDATYESLDDLFEATDLED